MFIEYFLVMIVYIFFFLCLWIGKKIFIIFYVCFMSPCVLAQEIVPFLQSLAVQQKAEQMKAAPSGVDVPLTEVILSAPSITQVFKDEKPSYSWSGTN